MAGREGGGGAYYQQQNGKFGKMKHKCVVQLQRSL